MSLPRCPACGSRAITTKACHSCGNNFHQGGKGGGGGGSSPIKGANMLGHFPGEKGGKEKFSDAQVNIHKQKGGYNTSLTAPDGTRRSVYVKTQKFQTESGREPSGLGSWSYRIGENTHTFNGQFERTVGLAAREGANRGQVSVELLP